MKYLDIREREQEENVDICIIRENFLTVLLAKYC